MPNVIARWESRGGAYCVNLVDYGNFYGYTGKPCRGSLAPVATDSEAVAVMQAKVDSGFFLLDRAVLPMKWII